MKIKRLQIQGFKSFVDKIDMSFPEGIITVVGPNGCGKSNVVDAMRWVLGEQSAKHLRGKLMEDIIFNGSEERKPVGMAEVSLTFDNGDGRAPAEYADYSEITVSRRLYRSGESEYYINKLPCRLKDITELFMDTGVGTKAYSIVEQGKIGAIVTMKPEERRALIEEAAGITKYKSRKNAALRKVDATQQNLLRVKDVIREIKRQINSLERQAKKAERYKGLKEELKELDISMAAQKFGTIGAALEEETKKLTECSDQETGFTASIAENDKTLESKKLDAARAEEELRKEQEAAYSTSNRIVEFEQKISFGEKEIERLGDDEKRYVEEIARLKVRLVDLDEKLQGLNGEVEGLAHKEKEESEKLKTSEAEFKEVSDRFNEKERGLEKSKAELVHIVTIKSNLNNTIVHLGERLRDIEKRLERKNEEKEDAGKLFKEAEKGLSTFEAKLLKLISERSSIDGSKSTEVERLTTLRRESGETEDEIKKLQEQIHRSESKLYSLEELKNSYEGLQAGVQSIMEHHKKSPLTDGIVGIVADLIDVPKEDETAVGAVLDQQLQYVVVKERRNGIEAVDFLKSHSAGRGTFITSQRDQNSPGKGTAASWKKAGVPIASRMNIKEGFEDLLDKLVGNVLLVSSMDEGLKQRDDGYEGIIVTPEGDIINSNGAITGGKGEGGAFDLLRREREIKELKKDLKAKGKELNSAAKKKDDLLLNIEKAEKELDELKEKEFAKDIEIANLEKDKSSAENELNREKERLEIISMEEEQLQGEIRDFNSEVSSSREKLEGLGKDEKEREQEITRTNEELSLLGKSVDELKEKVTELRITGESFTEKRGRLERELDGLNNSRGETIRLLERDEKALSEGKGETARIISDMGEGKSTLDNLLSDHQELKARLTEKKNIYDSIAEDIGKTEAALKDLHRNYDEMSRNASRLKVSVAEKEMEIKHLLEGIREKYQVDLAESYEDIPPSKEGDYEKLQTINRKIEEMGEVNLMALEEHKENMERLTFLEEQEKDLTEAIESLKKTINKINRTSRQRFKDAFDEVNEKFKEIFPKLFRGGKAQLLLTDEEDLLETGVDIVAQPPGKKLQNINLLSGGEKALTAITLIFSMFLVKPSPFCLLDEVDAPLDDANVGRFNELVTEMSKMSQIIMITHNKNSIGIGNTLYGITMEDPGVSKLVSVQMH